MHSEKPSRSEDANLRELSGDVNGIILSLDETETVEEQSALAADQQLVLTCERVSQSSAFALGSRPAACRFDRNFAVP
jgi:hypothetical protein